MNLRQKKFRRLWKAENKKMTRRLIYADALTDDILKSAVMIDDRGIQTGYEIAIELINRQPTIDAEPHWIPCSERLPEDGVYLVYAPEYRGGSSRSKECHEGLLFSVCKNGKWSIEHGYYSRPNCVIAWMPLPKPFKVYKMR